MAARPDEPTVPTRRLLLRLVKAMRRVENFKAPGLHKGEASMSLRHPARRGGGGAAIAYATIDGAGSATGRLTGSEVWPDGSVKSGGLVFDTRANGGAGEILAPGGTEGWDAVKAVVAVARAIDSAQAPVWVIQDTIGGIAGAPTIGDVGTANENAQTDSWSRTNQASNEHGVTIRVYSRPAYDVDGDQTWYSFYRDWTYTADGRLHSISAETRVTVDTPEECQ